MRQLYCVISSSLKRATCQRGYRLHFVFSLLAWWGLYSFWIIISFFFSTVFITSHAEILAGLTPVTCIYPSISKSILKVALISIVTLHVRMMKTFHGSTGNWTYESRLALQCPDVPGKKHPKWNQRALLHRDFCSIKAVSKGQPVWSDTWSQSNLKHSEIKGNHMLIQLFQWGVHAEPQVVSF